MTIALQIRLTSLFLILVSIGFGYSLFDTYKKLETQLAVNDVSQKMIKALFELNMITSEYVQSNNERAKIQWHFRHTSLEKLFANAENTFTSVEDKSSLKKIMSNEVQAESLLFKLFKIRENSNDIKSKAEARKETQTISQLQIHTQGMLSESSRMGQRSIAQLTAAKEYLEYTSTALISVFMLFFLTSLIFADRKIIRPITRLQENALKLSSGNYSTRINIEGSNEISNLATSYNHLADEIQGKISSLTDKTNRLNDSQNKLIDLNDNLQQMVDEQTRVLKDSETRQRAILESMNDAVIILDSDFIIKNTNPATMSIFGYQEEDILDQKINTLISINDKTLSVGYQEGEGYHCDHHTFPIEVTLSKINSEKSIIFTCIVRDITERKRAEKIKNEFISTISHELRTPLTSIIGSISLMAGGAAGELSETAQKLLSTGKRNSERLLNLINDLLDIQKIEAGKLEINLSQIELMPAIEKARIDNLGYAEQYNVDIQIGNRADNAIVTTDPHRLSQIMANLLSNAIKYSNNSGIVSIDSTIHNNFARISVEDRGEGIPADYHEKIFLKFSQNDSSSTRKKGGTGLGLSITKNMIEAMGGSIDFTSTLGKGTIFNIYLPLKTATLSAQP